MPLTPERRLEIEQWATRFGCANCWTGNLGTAATYIRELMDETLLPPGMEVSTSGSVTANKEYYARQGISRTVDQAAQRKQRPIVRGVLDYFPLAIAEVAHVSYVANRQHNGDEPMHWAREKSTDHADCIVRHLIDRGKFDTDGLRHTAKVAWRALALLQEELEKAGQTHEPSTNNVISPVVADVPAPHPFKQWLKDERIAEASA